MGALYELCTPKELFALIYWLPDDSALAAQFKGGREHLGWSWDRIALTLLLEQEQWNGFNFIKANSDKKSSGRLKPPAPLKIPGRPEPKASKGSMLPIFKALAAGGRPPELK